MTRTRRLIGPRRAETVVGAQGSAKPWRDDCGISVDDATKCDDDGFGDFGYIRRLYCLLVGLRARPRCWFVARAAGRWKSRRTRSSRTATPVRHDKCLGAVFCAFRAASAAHKVRLIMSHVRKQTAAGDDAFFAALACGASVIEAAKLTGCSRQALYRRRIRDRAFDGRWREAEEACKARRRPRRLSRALRRPVFETPKRSPFGNGRLLARLKAIRPERYRNA